mmetsp:Transcript_72410/g.235205  ORF Transcript_72410/g.235205 Transcript_72410/m.235205 type:complete len:201 (+) Transcript_72410:464-1066(+)
MRLRTQALCPRGMASTSGEYQSFWTHRLGQGGAFLIATHNHGPTRRARNKQANGLSINGSSTAPTERIVSRAVVPREPSPIASAPRREATARRQRRPWRAYCLRCCIVPGLRTLTENLVPMRTALLIRNRAAGLAQARMVDRARGSPTSSVVEHLRCTAWAHQRRTDAAHRRTSCLVLAHRCDVQLAGTDLMRDGLALPF